MDIKLANPRGFCAGVDRAIDIVDRALVLFGAQGIKRNTDKSSPRTTILLVYN